MQRGKNDGQYFYLFSAELFIRVLLYTSNRHSFSFVTFVRLLVAYISPIDVFDED